MSMTECTKKPYFEEKFRKHPFTCARAHGGRCSVCSLGQKFAWVATMHLAPSTIGLYFRYF